MQAYQCEGAGHKKSLFISGAGILLPGCNLCLLFHKVGYGIIDVLNKFLTFVFTIVEIEFYGKYYRRSYRGRV